MSPATITQKLWKYATILLADGMSYGDYVEQLTYLLFLKMADERTRPPYNHESLIPKKYNWESLLKKHGSELSAHYDDALRAMSGKSGVLGLIFGGAQNRFKTPARLQSIIADLIDKEKWSAMSADVIGAAYEGMLEKNAQDVQYGAGQYFTPRPLINAIVETMTPSPGKTVCDPACGTGGFLLAAHDYIIAKNKVMEARQKRVLKENTFFGCELVNNTARLCAMNLLLHGIGSKNEPPVTVGDSLLSSSAKKYDIVLTNPPFISRTDGRVAREDFWALTGQQQLNFVQHVYSMLKIDGRAAMVLPDNVLFEGGTGETVRRHLSQQCDVHTLLRLPTGVFFAQGVKANVLFFDKKPAAKNPWTKKLWIYDLRTGKNFTLKNNPLGKKDLADFIHCYNPKNRHRRRATYDADKNPQGRWRAYSLGELQARDKGNWDIFWLRDKSQTEMENLPPPEVLIDEIIKELSAAMDGLKKAKSELRNAGNLSSKKRRVKSQGGRR